jgi:hypothetical protein
VDSVHSWDREFQVWCYTVSYSQLLLRSLEADTTSRIDVLFSNVYLMHLKPSFSRLFIEVAPHDWLREPVELPARALVNLYLINHGEAYVLATHCQWHEDEGDHHSPSRFGPLRGVD